MVKKRKADSCIGDQRLRPESLMMSYGYKPALSEGAIKCPIFQTSTFVFKSAEEGKAFFELAYGLRERKPREELGLIYSVQVDEAKKVRVEMTLTSPACPVAETLPIEARDAALSVEGVISAEVEVVWDPPWTPERMTEAARLELGF